MSLRFTTSTTSSAAPRWRASATALQLAAALVAHAPATALVGVGALALAPAAYAQRGPAVAQPQIDRLEVTSDAGLAPGAELELRLFGTPRGNASVRISGAKPINVVLKESPAGSGEYVAYYTVKRADGLAVGQAVRATLRRGKLATVANYSVPAVAGAGTPPPAAGLRIDSFTAAPVTRLLPGTELVVTAQGMPRARGTFEIGGVASDIPMREVRPGVYEGRYTLRREDRITAATPVVASLRSGNQVVRANLAQPLVGDTTAPTVVNLGPRESERVPPGVVYVSGNFEDRRGTGVDPRSVRLALNGRDVTGDTQITAQSFSYRGQLPPGAYTAQLVARDGAGNELRRDWRFDVGAAPAVLDVQLTGPVGDVVDGRNPVVIRGRTAPGATVQARVTGLLQVAGPIGLEQELLNQTLTADGAGNFTVQFQPAGAPGSRYDVHVVSRRDGRSDEARLRLTQR